ncbi:MAG: hypothetical protein DSM106950_05600 [Stigonema ocellatum SAG 48.90 = DSM 106950]|nr:hypothetical protein [Stigonema ocellatum SAG 48.90 = DSM 106950]
MEQAHENEASLKQEIVDLQSSSSDQKELVEQLKKELDEAKQAAVYLAQTNSKLTEEIGTLKHEPKTSKAITYRRQYRQPEHLPKKQPGASDSFEIWLFD